MDVDLEMVARGKNGPDMIVPAEELRSTDIIDNPMVRRQNFCFMTAIFACAISFGVFVVGKLYMQPVEGEIGLVEGGGGGGPADLNHTIHGGIGNGKFNYTSGGKGWGGKHPNNHGHTDPPTTSPTKAPTPLPTQIPAPGDISEEERKKQEWLATTIHLSDGIKYEVVDQLVHDKNAFTEGLCYVDGRLFESVGLTGQSDLRELNATTGEVLNSWTMPGSVFGEGLTLVNGELVQLTWKAKKGYRYDLNNLDEPPTEFSFDTTRHEGWGLTTNTNTGELIESDGSSFLHIWDPATMTQKRKVEVIRLDGSKAQQINELEFWRGRVLANIWYKDWIFVIDPDTGKVEKEYNFEELWNLKTRKRQRAGVLNGISVSAEEDTVYVTGKNWDRMYTVRLLP